MKVTWLRFRMQVKRCRAEARFQAGERRKHVDDMEQAACIEAEAAGVDEIAVEHGNDVDEMGQVCVSSQ